MPAPSISDFLNRMPAAFLPANAIGVDATIQLKLTGVEAADYFITIHDSKCSVSPGAAASPRLTVTADSDNFVKIFSGQLDGMQAFMQGKLKVSGDMNLAMKLMGLFKMS